ncbi:MAG: VWA domain-containing protein [Maricaulaceae bacterium]|jgi:Ca-activated chloride channel family protein
MVFRFQRALAGLAAAAAFGFASGPAPAQDDAAAPEDAILVLDGSGSMWGQIEGVAKISIARDVIDGLLTDLPAERRLGLVAYGHNRRGDCSDIETLASLGADRDAIRTAVDDLNPIGMTPLTASVQYAAEELAYTERRATVILVTDGKETCDLDPCAVGAELERLGVDFTAHVIGFDIVEEHDRLQLQCLAENTGGVYLDASNAEELTTALNETVVEVAPEPVDAATILTLRATELAGGPEIEEGLTWRVVEAGGGETAFELTDAGATETEVEPGAYDVFVEAADGLTGEARNVVVAANIHKHVTIALEYNFEATLELTPEGEAPVGSEVVIAWTGPDRRNDYVTFTTPDAPSNSYTDYAYTRDGSPLVVEMPNEPGEYEARYVLGSPPRVLARVAITATPVEVTLEAVDTIGVGANFSVDWSGPGYDGDWVTVVAPDAPDNGYGDYAYTREGNPLTLAAPVEPGAYEVRYVLDGNTVLARRPIEVTASAATLTAPDTATVGAHLDVAWTGPDADRDWITVVAPDMPDNRYTDYAYTRDGSPLNIRMPLDPGTYELRYVLRGQEVIARKPIEIIPADVTLDAPASVGAGAEVSVAWTGPGEPRDWITITAPDAPDNTYTDYAYTRDGSPLSIAAPVEPGEYEVRYVLDGGRVIGRSPLTVTDATASFTPPEPPINGGATLSIPFEGPANPNDWITITAPDAADNAYTDYHYADRGSPAEIRAPAEPGTYELRYVLRGRRVIARETIVVETMAQ